MKLLLYLPQIILSLVAIWIIARCFISLFSMRPVGKPKAVLINKDSGQKLAISTYETSLGRAKNCDILLASTLASRSHAVISRRKKGWFITDTESKTGTFVNGEQTEGSVRIYHGDVITIGGVDYTFVAPHASREDSEPQPAFNSGVSGGLLNLATNYEYPIQNGKITIGRSEGCDVVIDDRTVSRFHATVQYTDEGWVVTDHDSQAGVGVNGYRIHGSEPISDGDKIMINTHIFMFKDYGETGRRGARG
ncbi:MAG: FHA domain-containing protein [Ruminococcaceae bacterium]|nr:FHA domain-containing protein [Oscillospiraceae bacterium]